MEGEISSRTGQRVRHAPIHDYEEIVSRFVTTFPQSDLQVLLYESGESNLQTFAGSVSGPLEPQKPDDSLLEQVIESGQSIFLNSWGEAVAPSEANMQEVVRSLVPVTVRQEIVGFLYARVNQADLFTSQCFSYLQTAASYIGISLHTQRLVEEAWQWTAEMETVHGVTEAARTLKPLYPIIAEIHAQIVRAFDVQSFYVALYHRDERIITFPYAVDNNEEVDIAPIPVDRADSLVAWVVRNQKAYLTGDWIAQEAAPGLLISETTPRTALCFPLVVNGEVVGALTVQSERPHAFDEHETKLLASIADHVAVLVHDSKIYSNAREMVDSMAREYLMAATMRQAVSAMGTSLDLEAILERFLSVVKGLVPVESATLTLMKDEELVFYEHAPYGDVAPAELLERGNEQLRDSPLLKQVVETLEPVVIEDVRVHPDWIVVEGVEHIRSWIAVPLVASNELLGILMLDSVQPGAYGQREVWLASTLASHAALALQNARLHAEIQRQLHELTTLYEAGAKINANLDREAVIGTVVQEMMRALRAESCAILVGHETHQLRLAVHHKIPESTADEENGLRDVSELGFDSPGTHRVLQHVFQSSELLNLSRSMDMSDHEQALLEEIGHASALLAPLVHGERSLGVVLLGRTTVAEAFSDREIRLARNLVGQAAAALEHAQLYTQAQRRIEELSTFHEIVLHLNTPLELEEVLRNITEAALRLIEANNLHIYLWDEEKDEFTFCSALWRDGSRQPAVDAPRKDGLTASVVHSGEAVFIDNANSHPLYQSDEASEWGVQAIAGFPLRHSGRVIGAFTVTYVEPHRFSRDEQLLMNLLADQAAVAVENARIFSDAQQRLRSMSALVDMAKQVTGNLKVGLVLQTTVQTLQKLLNARASTIALLSDDGRELSVEAAAGIKPQYHRVRIRLGEGVSGRAVSERRMIYIRDTYREPDFLFFDDVLRSLLVVPLITRNEVIGTLTVDSDRPEAFSESDTQLLTIAAAQVSVAIGNARLFEALEERAAELAVAYEELKENDRLKDELVQNVSHELRTPLTFIRGYVDLLVDGELGDLSADQVRALKVVAQKTAEVTRLVEDIMSLQRIDGANLIHQTFSLASLLEEAADCYELSASQRGLKLVLQPPTSRGIVDADRGRINQVLDNLIGNAMKFSPDGGTIELRMIERQDDVLAVVADEGIGVPEDKVNRIFDRFYQVDGSARRRFGGAGIGLAIVKRIIDAHQGDIWVKSETDVGSRFYFTIPKRPRADGQLK